jgi:TolA-binding protein
MIKELRAKSILITLLILFVSSIFAQSPTRLQVLFTTDKAKAERTVQKIDRMGLGPAQIQASGNGYMILTRAFDSYAEANYYKPQIRKAGFNEPFAVKEEKTAQGTVFGDVRSIALSESLKKLRIDFETQKKPFERPVMTEQLRNLDPATAGESDLFNKAMAFREQSETDEAISTFESFIVRFPLSPKLAKAKLMRGYWLNKKKDYKSAREQFEAITKEHPNQQEAGEAHLRCAYLMLLDKRPDPEVLQRFLPVANGSIPAEDEVRLEAMLRCAALYYKGKDLETADAAYLAIENATKDPNAQAFAEMQRAGILLEMAYNGKRPYSDSRSLCDDLVKKFPNVNIQIRSTASLMALESLAREENYEEVINRSEVFFREFLETPEAPIAHFWIAKAYFKTGNSQMASKILEDILLYKYDIHKRFKYVEIDESAKRLASEVYKSLGDMEKSRNILVK